MNILFEIAGKDYMFIGLVAIAIVIFGAIIFYILNKNEKLDEIEIEEESKEEYFSNIKPKTQEQQEAKDELEKVFNQMAHDLEEKNKAPRVVEEYEREQEENAIISYQELIAQAEKKRENPNMDFEEFEKEEPKKFRNSDIISPIFGIQSADEYKKTKKKVKKEIEEDNREELKNLEFLKSLKEFRQNL